MKKKKTNSTKKPKPSKRKEKAERLKTIMEVTGMSKKTVQNAAWLARRIRPDMREYVEKLSYKHLAAVATLHPDDQKVVLEAAEKNKWTAELTGRYVLKIKMGENKFAAHELEKTKRALRKIADRYREIDVFKEIVESIDDFIATVFVPPDEPPSEPPTTPPTTSTEPPSPGK